MNATLNISRPCCFAVVPYANAAPLAQFIPVVCPQASVITDYPARLPARLLDRTADAAMIPVADLFAHANLAMIDGLGICATRKVRSVLLKCYRPLEQVETVELDVASRTSNALALLLLRHHWRRAVRAVPAGSGIRGDAVVVIGDRALCEPPGSAGDYDLAEHWNRMTGLPFVFAVWAFRHDHPAPGDLARVAHAARQEGVAALPELARQQAARLGLSEKTCLDYYATCIHYDVGPLELRAMQLFRQLIGEESAATPEGGVA